MTVNGLLGWLWMEGIDIRERTIISLPGFAGAAGHRWVLLMIQWVSHVRTPTAAGVCSSAPAPIKTGWPQPPGLWVPPECGFFSFLEQLWSSNT